MTLVIITKVKLKQVNSSQLKGDPTGHPIWFNDLDRDLYLIIGENELRHFEISIQSDLLSGGASKALQYGKIKDDAGSRQDLSRLVDYQNQIPEQFKEQTLNLIQDCEGLEPSLKTGLIKYIEGFSFGSNPLRFSEALKSYVPIEKRKISKPRVPLSRQIRALIKKLPKHLGLKAVGLLLIASVISVYFSMSKSLGNRFLGMDSRLNIGYIKKYIAKDGKLDIVDSSGRNILHRTAPFLDSVDSERYRAFEFLILNKGVDPNQFDNQGRTPLYFLIVSYLHPEISRLDNHPSYKAELAAVKNDKLRVIEKLLKLGLDSRLKDGPDGLTAFVLGSKDAELKDLLQKYR